MKRLFNLNCLKIQLYIFLGLLTTYINASPIDYEQFYEKWKNSPSASLNIQGDKYVMENKLDSARAYYSIIANRYISNMSDYEKKLCGNAYNNLGYIYFYGNSDYFNAYVHFLKALQICEEINDAANLPYIYLNIGNIFMVYNDIPKACDMYRKAFYAAANVKDYHILLIIYSNYLDLSILENNLTDMTEVIDTFCNLNIPDTIPLYQYVCLSTEGARQLMNKNYELATQAFLKQKEHINTLLTPERFLLLSLICTAQALYQQGNYKAAIEQLHKAEKASDTISTVNDIRIHIYDALKNCYNESGDKELAEKYHLKWLKIKDNVQNLQNFTRVKDLESNYALYKMDNKVRELVQKRRIQKQITQIILSGSIIITILLIRICFQYYRLKKNNRELYRKNIEILDNEKQERQQRRMYERMLNEYKTKLEHTSSDNDKPRKYMNSNLNESDKEYLGSRIKDIMETSEAIYNMDFSIEYLATLVGSNVKYVSQTINEIFQKNFNTLLQEYRIKEACKRLADSNHYGHLTIEAIAEGVGFKNRSNFILVFKKVTGLTPSQYQNISRTL